MLPVQGNAFDQLRTLNWFDPNRIMYHIGRDYRLLREKSRIQRTPMPDGDQIRDVLYVRYAFSYCKTLALYALNFISTIKQLWRKQPTITLK